MNIEDMVAYFEAQGFSFKKALVLAALALEAEGTEDAP